MASLTEVASIRVHRGTKSRLRRAAHDLSLHSGREYSWAGLLREIIDRTLVELEGKPVDPISLITDQNVPNQQ